MEEINYKDNFEQFLKDTADDFRMVPSRKVWYSIYNDMHPDRKWPSMAVCLLILSAVLYIGVSNNNSLSDAARRAALENLSGIAKNYASEKNVEVTVGEPKGYQNISQKFYKSVSPDKTGFLKTPDNKTFFSDLLNAANSPDFIYAATNIDQTEYSLEISAVEKEAPFTSVEKNTSDKSIIAEENNTVQAEKKIKVQKNAQAEISFVNIGSADNDPTVSISESVLDNHLKNNELKKSALQTNADNAELSWKEDHAFRNKPAVNKLKERASITYYITPSLGYRNLIKTRQSYVPVVPSAGSSSFAPGASAPAPVVINNAIKDDGALNLEAGVVLRYALSERLNIRSGIQLNFTNYISRVTELGHPAQTELAVISPNVMRSAFYSSQPGNQTLNRNTLQIAVPVGLDFKIAGNEKIKWYIGADLQPAYMLSGSGYVLSADEKNYITETNLLRNWNLNTAVETFISFKPSSAVTLNIGPQFRYQLLSTFKKEYNYTERLYNVGMKIGISTRF